MEATTLEEERRKPLIDQENSITRRRLRHHIGKQVIDGNGGAMKKDKSNSKEQSVATKA